MTTVSAARPPTAEQRKRERALVGAAVLDFGTVGLLLGLGTATHSLTNAAEGLRALLMALIDLVSLAVLCRLHRGTLTGFDFGTSKIEQLCSIAIALGLAGATFWLGTHAVRVALDGHSDATPLGLSFAAVGGSMNLFANLVAWDNVRRTVRGRPSAIMRAQQKSRMTKLVCSIVVQVTMTVAAVAKDPVIVAIADALGALIVCAVMARAAWILLVEAVPDVLDLSINHIVEPALRTAAKALPVGLSLGDFRSRGTPRSFALEVALVCTQGTYVATMCDAERRLAAALVGMMSDAQISLVVRAVPAEQRPNPVGGK